MLATTAPNPCTHEDARGFSGPPTIIVRLRTREDDPVDPDEASKQIQQILRGAAVIEERECWCHGYPVPALVVTIYARDHWASRQLAEVVDRLSPLLGDQIVMRGPVHIEAEALTTRSSFA